MFCSLSLHRLSAVTSPVSPRPAVILLRLCCASPPPARLNVVLKLFVDLWEPDESAAKKKMKWLSKDKLHWPERGCPFLRCSLYPTLTSQKAGKDINIDIFLPCHSSKKQREWGSEEDWRETDRKKSYGSWGRVGGLVGIWQSTQTPIHLVCPLSSTVQGDGLARVVKVSRVVWR